MKKIILIVLSVILIYNVSKLFYYLKKKTKLENGIKVLKNDIKTNQRIIELCE